MARSPTRLDLNVEMGSRPRGPLPVPWTEGTSSRSCGPGLPGSGLPTSVQTGSVHEVRTEHMMLFEEDSIDGGGEMATTKTMTKTMTLQTVAK